MSTYTGVEVAGTEVESYRNHHSRWFFNRSDRVRENCERDEHGKLPDEAFIGYRTTVASVRRRMTLSGYDLAACEQHFRENLPIIVEAAESHCRQFEDDPGTPSSVSSRLTDAYRLFTEAVKDTSLQDWLDVLPEAVKLNKSITRRFSQVSRWRNVSAIPLVNAMLSDIPLYTEYTHTDLFNFPSNGGTFFQVAWLACCPDDAVCELNIAPLIQSGYEEDFRDLEEIQQEDTAPHALGRESIIDIQSLSDTQPHNLSLQRMCYASIITAMEAYLGDILKREIFTRQAVKALFVSSYDFKKPKFTLSEIYTKLATIDTEIKDALDGLSLHKIDTAMKIFRSSLLTEFPAPSLPFLGASVQRRHDIVHRNGRDTDGEPVSIGHEDVTELACQVLMFTRAIDEQILDGLLHEHEADRD